MSKANFDEHIRDNDVNLLRKITETNIYKLTEGISKYTLVALYLAARAAYGSLAWVTRQLFSMVLTEYPKDKELQESYLKGVVDGEKRRPFDHSYKTKKSKCAYEHGRMDGEEEIKK